MKQATKDRNAAPAATAALVKNAEAFSDTAAVLCRPGDHRLGAIWSERGGYEQMDDGPICIVIGRETNDEKCQYLASRFGLDVAELISFRDSATSKTRAGLQAVRS